MANNIKINGSNGDIYKNDLLIGNMSDLSEIPNKALLNGDSTQTFNVAFPISPYNSANKEYVDNKPTGFKNYIINGGFDIWQRGTSFNGTPGGLYTSDRFIARRNLNVLGYSVFRSPVAPIGFNCSLSLKRDNGDSQTNNVWTQQIIETSSVKKLEGKTVTLSFYARCGVAYTPTDNLMNIRVSFSPTVDAGISASGGNISEENATHGANFQLTTTFQRFTTTFVVPVGTNTFGVSFRTNDFVGTADDNDFILIAGVQLEEGSVATPFEHRPIGLELSLCQRYYWTNYTERIYGASANESSVQRYLNIRYPVSMRVTPILNYDYYHEGSSGPDILAGTDNNQGISLYSVGNSGAVFSVNNITADAEIY